MEMIKQILSKQIERIKPEKYVLDKIKKISSEFCLDLKKRLKNKKIIADVFVGGSLAKNTLIKKNKYDIDVFVRFDEIYADKNISELLGKVLTKAQKIHGSRDYYQIIKRKIIIEIIPVIRIKNPRQAKNIMDLSYFHVNYVNSKIKKNRKLADETILAKTFIHAQNCYGAESYVKGFSGYSIELLICYYKSFINFIEKVAETKDKLVIDESKHYKNKQQILRELNESKIQSPIILIDPTYKERNALAGLSIETFLKFKKACANFLKNPNEKFFKKRDRLKELKQKYKNKINIISIKTNKQKGDIAGTKSKKFFDFFACNLGREFKITEKEFEYNEEKNTAWFYFVLNKKPNEVVRGPKITALENLNGFKKAHPNSFIKNQFAYANISHNLNFKEFFNKFKKKNKKIIKQMGVKEIRLMRDRL